MVVQTPLLSSDMSSPSMSLETLYSASSYLLAHGATVGHVGTGLHAEPLKGVAVNAKDQPRSLAIVAAGSNSLLMSMLLHCSKKDVDVSDIAQLRSLTISMRLRVDNNEQHLSCYGLDSSTSFAHPSVMPPRENIVDVEEEVHNLVCQHHFLVIAVSHELLELVPR